MIDPEVLKLIKTNAKEAEALAKQGEALKSKGRSEALFKLAVSTAFLVEWAEEFNARLRALEDAAKDPWGGRRT